MQIVGVTDFRGFGRLSGRGKLLGVTGFRGLWALKWAWQFFWVNR